MYSKSLCCPRGITAHPGFPLSCPMKPSPLLPNTDLHASHFESFELISAGSASMYLLTVCFSLYLLLQTQYILNSELKFLPQEASPPLLSSHWPFEKLPNAAVLTCHIILWRSFKTTVHPDIEPSWYSDYPVFTKHWAQSSAPHEGMEVPTCNPSIWEMGIGRSEFKEIQEQPVLCQTVFQHPPPKDHTAIMSTSTAYSSNIHIKTILDERLRYLNTSKKKHLFFSCNHEYRKEERVNLG